MPPPSSSPSHTNSGSPSTIPRDNYTNTTPHMNRGTFSPSRSNGNSGGDYLTRNGPYTISRGSESGLGRLPSPSSIYGTPAMLGFDSQGRPSSGEHGAPPFDSTKYLCGITSSDGQQVFPDIQAKIDKNFFKVDSKWTCYRRNYFSVVCSFFLRPHLPSATLYLQHPSRGPETIQSFSISISAVVNGEGGESRELIQHTPKRNKESESKPGKVKLQPQAPPSLGPFSAGGVASGHLSGYGGASQTIGMTEYDPSYMGAYPVTTQSPQTPTVHTFERIQFQKATANNGKRRAQQQFYNVVVELYAELSPHVPSPDRWVKVASRLSAPMVVRGRSPGHYRDRRDSSSSMGPEGGGLGRDGGGPGPMMSSGSLPGLGQTSLTYDRGGLSGMGNYRSIHHSPIHNSSFLSSSSSQQDYNDGLLGGNSVDMMDSSRDESPVDSYARHPIYHGLPLETTQTVPASSTYTSVQLPHVHLPFSSHRASDHDMPFTPLAMAWQEPQNKHMGISESLKSQSYQTGQSLHLPWPGATSPPRSSNNFNKGCGRLQGFNGTLPGFPVEMEAL